MSGSNSCTCPRASIVEAPHNLRTFFAGSALGLLGKMLQRSKMANAETDLHAHAEDERSGLRNDGSKFEPSRAAHSNLPSWVLDTPRKADDDFDRSLQSGMEREALLTLNEVARMLQVSTRTVSRLIARGALLAIRVGRSIRVRQVDLNDMMRRSYLNNITQFRCRE